LVLKELSFGSSNYEPNQGFINRHRNRAHISLLFSRKRRQWKCEELFWFLGVHLNHMRIHNLYIIVATGTELTFPFFSQGKEDNGNVKSSSGSCANVYFILLVRLILIHWMTEIRSSDFQ